MVATQLTAEAELTVVAFTSVVPDQLGRRGLRSDCSAFTLDPWPAGWAPSLTGNQPGQSARHGRQTAGRG